MSENFSISHKKIFFPNLDGIRTIAFLMVIIPHCFQTFPLSIKYTVLNFLVEPAEQLSNMGVNLFFVLSGFLITYLLLHEEDSFGKINLKNFYIRRILRIWPVYYLAVIGGFIIIFFIFHLLPLSDLTWKGIWHYLLFMVNFEHIDHGLSHRLISVLWSVSVEEQFYLVWPVLLMIWPRKQYLGLFLILISGSLFYRYNLSPDSYRLIHYHTFSVAVYLAMGGLGAWLVRKVPSFLRAVENAPKISWIFLYLFIPFYTWYLLKNHDNNVQIMTEGFIYAILFLMIILEQNFAKNSFYKMGHFTWLDKTGKYTYGLYSLHFFALFIVYTLGTRVFHFPDTSILLFILQSLVGIVLAYLIAWVSYNYYEKYFLKLKNKFDLLQK